MVDNYDDSEKEEVPEEPMPKHRVRFSDMPQQLVNIAIRTCNDLNEQQGQKLDKDLATEIQKKVNETEGLKDESAGWHVIVGKSFASAITYQTKWVIFFDLLESQHKTFLLFKTQ